MGDVELLKHRLGFKNQLFRLLWTIVWSVLIRPIPRTYANGWKIFILRLFGAKLSGSALVYSSAKVYDPGK